MFQEADLPGVRHQEVQQIELAGGELDRVVVLGDGARGGVETERPDLDRDLLISAPAAPQDGSDPRRELARSAPLEVDGEWDPERDDQHDEDVREREDESGSYFRGAP